MDDYKKYRKKMRQALRQLNFEKVAELIEENWDAFQTMHNGECITNIVLESIHDDKADDTEKRHIKRIDMIQFLKKMGVDMNCKNSKKLFTTWKGMFPTDQVKKDSVQKFLDILQSDDKRSCRKKSSSPQQRSTQGSVEFYTAGSILVGVLVSTTIVLLALRK